MTIKTKAALAAAITAALLAACGGGGDADPAATGGNSGNPGAGNPVGNPVGGGIDGSGVAYGTVTGYGSIIVNGVRYEDNGVTITRSDDSTVRGDGAGSVTRDNLPIGSVVRVDYNSASNVLGIRVDDSISGRVEQVISGVGVRVMGQTVRIDDTTSQYEDNVLRTGGVTLAVGDFIRVQGSVDASGAVQASYVSKRSSSGTLFEVKGVVSNHNGSSSFSVGSLNVTYSSSTITNDMPSGSWNGLVVEVKGSNCTNVGNVCGTLVATKVEPEGSLPRSSSRAQAEVEGIVLSGTAASFKIGNVTVNTSASTRWEGGTPDDFAIGVKLEAEGALANGVLTATKVSLRDGSRLEGNVVSPVLANGLVTFTLQGLPGITIKASGVTSLTNGTHVRVRGRVSPDGKTVVATELDVRSADTRTEVRSMVTAISGTTVTVLGTAIDIAGLSYRDSRSTSGSGNSVPMTSQAFFAALKVGSTIKLRSDNNGQSWREAELESD